MALLAKGRAARLDPKIKPNSPPSPETYTAAYRPRIPIMTTLSGSDITSPTALAYLKAQISSDDQELARILKPLRAPPKPKSRAAQEKQDREEKERETDHALQHYKAMEWDQSSRSQVTRSEDMWQDLYARGGKEGGRAQYWQTGIPHRYSMTPKAARV
ncbi:hypothetical protein P3342_006865 [Pyrenophora teres f. teres]|nr:hypothetical protein P3342_006865 [Pyrenophora teres f. teres]